MHQITAQTALAEIKKGNLLEIPKLNLPVPEPKRAKIAYKIHNIISPMENAWTPVETFMQKQNFSSRGIWGNAILYNNAIKSEKN